MNSKQLINSVIVLVILGGIALFVFKKDTSSWKRGGVIEKQKLLKDFDVNKVSEIQITTTGKELTIKHSEDGKWVVENRNNYPADFAKLSDLLLKLKALEVVDYPRLVKAQFPSLHLVIPGKDTKEKQSGTLLTCYDKDHKKLLELIVGKQHFPKKEPASPMEFQSSSADGRYVMVVGSDTPALVKNPLDEVTSTPKKWINHHFLTMPNIISVSRIGNDGKPLWKIYRKYTGAPWNIAGLKKGENPLPGPMHDVTSTFEHISFDDVSSASGVDLKNADTIEIVTATGIKYTINLLKKQKKTFAKFAVTAVAPVLPPTQGKKDSKDQKNRNEIMNKALELRDQIIEKDKFYTQWLYEFPTYRIDKVLKKRKELYKSPIPQNL